MSDVSSEKSGLYFLTARNNQAEEKYPVVLKIRPNLDLNSVTDCGIENG